MDAMTGVIVGAVIGAGIGLIVAAFVGGIAWMGRIVERGISAGLHELSVRETMARLQAGERPSNLSETIIAGQMGVGRRPQPVMRVAWRAMRGSDPAFSPTNLLTATQMMKRD